MTLNLQTQDFIPDRALQLLKGAQVGASQAKCYGSKALVLFVDMSGFSRLASERVTQSERGAEGLGALINAVFEEVVASVTAHGGSLLYYAGDAVNATWPGDANELGSACARAVACGLDIQERCKKLPDMWQGQSIEMKANLRHGPLWCVDAPGTPEARQILFCGAVLEGLAQDALNASGQGVSMNAALFAALDNHVTGKVEAQKNKDTVRVTALQSIDLLDVETRERFAASDAYLQPFLRSSIALGAETWLAEFRTAHVLFVRVPEFTFAGESDLEHVADIINKMCLAVHRQGGTLLQICTDDKGLVCLAAWGLAKSAYENDAARAVLAAQTLTGDLKLVGVKANAAVTSGKIFAGLLGARPLLQYSVVGDVLSRAASMAVEDFADVTLDQTSKQSLPSEITSKKLTDITLKGHSAPTAVFVPIGEQVKRVDHAGDFVGRATECQNMNAMLPLWRKGQANDIRIIAEAGIGKSRLAAWFEERLHDAGMQALRMNAEQLRQTSSYLPLRQVFDALLDWPEDMNEHDCSERLAQMFEGEAKALNLLPLLSPVLPVDIAENDHTETLIGAGRAELTRGMIVSLLEKLLDLEQGEVAVLIVEDAHWLDSASWLCIEAAKRDIDGLALMIVARPIDEDQIPTEAKKLFAEDDRALHLKLGPLSREDTHSILGQTLGGAEVADQITELVIKEAAGHPLYTTALCGSLLDRGLIRLEDGYAHLHLGGAPLSSLSFPQGVQGVISQRISSLDLNGQLTIKTAAVLGRYFELSALSDVYPLNEDAATLNERIFELVASGLIEDQGEGRFRFHHAIIADCAHEMLTSEQQHSLHRAAGDRIEALAMADGGEAEQTELALMAYHFEAANMPSKAVPYLSEAARVSRRSYSNVEIVDFLTRAIALSDASDEVDAKPLQLSEWRVQIAESLRALGQYQRAEEFLKSAISTLERPAPETGFQAAGQLLREFAKLKLRPHRAEQPETQRKPIITAADANMMLSEIHYELNKIPFALSEILKGANLARKAGGDSQVLAKLYIGMALISTSLPWALDGDELQAQALEIVDRLDDPATASWVYMVSGVYETGKGGWARGADQLNQSRVVSEACGERKTWETAMSCLGNLKRLEGYFSEAKGWSDLTMQASRERGIDHGIIWSHNGRARDLLCLSDFDELREDVAALERMLNDPTKTGDSNDNNNLVFHYASAFCALKEHRDEDARAELDTVIEMLKRIKRPQVYMVQNVDYYSDIIWALWARGHRDAELLEQQKLVLKSGKQVAKQYRTGAPMAHLAQGDAAWFKGDAQAAEKSWRASVEAANQLGMAYNAAHALFRLEGAGLASADTDDWRNLLSNIGIERPLIWQFDA
ncbi:AAA family ATPase [Planktotalea sp.]|uniref:AAA family ATPase n=1 Tax=Planktotalea sp. TaxID=2029877 RepID=UPI003D6B17B2